MEASKQRRTMFRTTILGAGLATALVLAAPVGGAAEATPKLKGSVGPGFTINLKRGATVVRTLTPGRYMITVTDRSNIHNFRLRGPGLNKRITTVAFTGTKTVTVTVRRGTYTYICDPHPTNMKKTFRVR
jgi:plastocyanin